MIDWHTHILPNMDDGSSSAEESVQMLICEKKQGVKKIILTPHYYAYREDASVFLRRRTNSFWRLKEAMHLYIKENSLDEGFFPELEMAAEVYLFERLHRLDMDSFVFGDKRYLLIEMPFASWIDRDMEMVGRAVAEGNITPVIAHVDRYLKYKGVEERLKELTAMGAVLQVNTDAVQPGWGGRQIRKVMKQFDPVVLGSDCHNMVNRKPDWSRISQR